MHNTFCMDVHELFVRAVQLQGTYDHESDHGVNVPKHGMQTCAVEMADQPHSHPFHTGGDTWQRLEST